LPFFQIHKKSDKSLARLGQINFARGKVNTPNFMVIATQGSIKSLSTEDLLRLEAEIVLSNTYHLWQKPGMLALAANGGLHDFMQWQSPILTDSGGFQAWSLAKERKFTEKGVFFKRQKDGLNMLLTPEKALKIQSVIGSDVALVLDQVENAESSKDVAKFALERTIRWAERSIKARQELEKNNFEMNLKELDTPFLTPPKPNKKGVLDPNEVRKFERLKKSVEKEIVAANLDSPLPETLEIKDVDPLEGTAVPFSQKSNFTLTSTSKHTSLPFGHLSLKGEIKSKFTDSKTSFEKVNPFPGSRKFPIFGWFQGVAPKELGYFRNKSENIEWDNRVLEGVSTTKIKGFKNLFGILQGAKYNDLRKMAVETVGQMDFDGFCIGGVAQGGEAEEVMYSQVLTQTEILNPAKPRHLLGVGRPEEIVECVKRGIDLFDCVYPTRNARHGSVLVWTDINRFEYQTLKITSKRFIADKTAINSNSKMPELRKYSRAYLCHLFKAKELLAYRLATLNNLEFYYDLMREIRRQVREGVL